VNFGVTEKTIVRHMYKVALLFSCQKEIKSSLKKNTFREGGARD